MFDIFRIKRKKFKFWLEYENQEGLILLTDTDSHWYIHISSKPDNFLENQCFVIRLFTDMKGVVCKSNLVFDFENNSLLIGDIESKVENRGYGSLVLKSIIKLACENGVKEIIGNLSKVDSDHFDKLEQFYSKHDFDVIFYDKRTEGKIILNLCKNN